MATVIRPDDSEREVHPADPAKGFTLEEVYLLTECDCIDIVGLSDGRRMVVDDNGLDKKLPHNPKATALYRRDRVPGPWNIVGTVLVSTLAELEPPEPDEDDPVL